MHFSSSSSNNRDSSYYSLLSFIFCFLQYIFFLLLLPVRSSRYVIPASAFHSISLSLSLSLPAKQTDALSSPSLTSQNRFCSSLFRSLASPVAKLLQLAALSLSFSLSPEHPTHNIHTRSGVSLRQTAAAGTSSLVPDSDFSKHIHAVPANTPKSL